nr:uncharacterized protein LOC102551354 [Rattus norvegicus]
MFTLNFSLASPKEESLYCPAPRVVVGEGVAASGGGSLAFVHLYQEPLPHSPWRTRALRVSPGGSWARALRVSRPVEVTLQNFLSLTLHEGVRSLGSGEWRVRMQVPGLTKQSERSACVLCTSGGAGEPAQQPSGRLGDSWETEAVESGSGIFKWMFGCRFWGKVNREDRVRSDPLLLKHQIEGRAVLSVKVYNNLSIHRMQNNKM